MFIPKILSGRPFSLSDLRIEHHPSTWISTPAYEALVQREWRNLLRETKTRVWDGTYYRVQNPTVFEDSESAPILLGTIAYRYIATFPCLSQEHSRFGLAPLNHLSTVALLQTTDDLYVFGTRQRNGAVDLIGGGAQCDEIEIHHGADLEKNLYKEFHEEAGLTEPDVGDLAGIGVVYSSTSNVIIVGHAKLNLNSADVQTRFLQRTDEEMDRLVFVSDRNLREFLSQMQDYRSLLAQLEW